MPKILSKLVLVVLLSNVFAACSKAPPPIVEAPRPAYPGAGTVVQEQFKVLEDAKKIEQQGLDAEAKRRAEFDQ